MSIEISWDDSARRWCGEFFKDAIHAKDVIHGQVFGDTRRSILGMLRLEIARKTAHREKK